MKKGTSVLLDVAILVERNVIKKVVEMILKCKYLKGKGKVILQAYWPLGFW
jgi:hypothetical protein